MPRPKGLPKTGGRKKGTRNIKATIQYAKENVREEIKNRIIDLLVGLIPTRSLMNSTRTQVIIEKGRILDRETLTTLPYLWLQHIPIDNWNIEMKIYRWMAALVPVQQKEIARLRKLKPLKIDSSQKE